MRVLSAAEMQACDRTTTERFGVPSLKLMRSAATAVAAFAREQFPNAKQVTVLCGRGNNGGDGLMTARMLASAGLRVTTILLGTPEGMAGDAAAAWRELASPAQGLIHIVKTPGELLQFNTALQTDLIVDAVVGTGFIPPLKGMALAALEWIKGSAAPVLAVDLPSGWPSDSSSGSIDTPVFPADAVITFTAPKPAHVFGQLTRRWDQPIVVAPIGSPDAAIVSELGLSWAGDAHEITEARRPADSNKGRFGHVLVVGGTFGSGGGKAGAPAMTALTALRSGAGLVTAAVPAPAMATVSAMAPELMLWPLATTQDGHISAESLAPAADAHSPSEKARVILVSQAQVDTLTAGKTVLAIGPGMGQTAETAKFMTGLLTATRMPAVIDADALNILASKPVLLTNLTKMAVEGRTFVLTPHPGEMARLTGTSVAEVQANRLETARGFAKRNCVTLVLKGYRTLIAHPDGSVAVNTTGNPAMAKGGSGDMLTGLIAGFLAQYPGEAARAIEAAVYMHGLAADLAMRDVDEHTLLPMDTLGEFSRAFRFRSRRPNGYVWLQGHCLQRTPTRAEE